MKMHTIHEAKTNLSKLIEKASAGEEVIIARGKKPVAKICSKAGAWRLRGKDFLDGRRF